MDQNFFFDGIIVRTSFASAASARNFLAAAVAASGGSGASDGNGASDGSGVSDGSGGYMLENWSDGATCVGFGNLYQLASRADRQEEVSIIY